MGQLTNLLRQPRDRTRHPAPAVALAVRVAHELLELSEVHNHCIFANRHAAGRALAAQLADLAGRDDVVVFGLPRGGVPVAAEVAAAIGAPLDVFVVRKVGAPQQPELAVGAVASGRAVVLNDDIVRHLGIEPPRLDELIAAQQQEVERRERLYRGDRPPIDVTGKTAVVVDDGIATGASMRVALVALRRRGATPLVAAAPIAPLEMRTQLADVADRVELVDTPLGFSAVGAWYDDFRQVDDEEVQRLLNP